MNPRQELFCFEYSHSLNAADAAIKAGYSAASAYVIGHENLRKPYMQARITQLLDERRTAQQRQFVNANDAAIAALVEIINSPRAAAQARVSAAVAILDRGGHSIITKSLVKAEVNVNGLSHEQRIERLNWLLEQGRNRRTASDTGCDAGPG